MLPKLNEYLARKGIMKTKFAERIGISPSLLHVMLTGPGGIPTKYWRRIIEESDHHVTLKDLCESHPDFAFFEVSSHKNYPGAVMLTLKETTDK